MKGTGRRVVGLPRGRGGPGGLVMMGIGFHPVYLSERALLGVVPGNAHGAIGSLLGYGLPFGTALWAVLRRFKERDHDPTQASQL